MKILAISDRPPDVPIKKIFNYEDLDLICVLGDLDFFGLADLEFITHIPKIGIYGDKCSGTYFEKLGIRNVHLETFKHQGIVFGGFEGALKIEDRSYSKSYTQKESLHLLENFPKVDVMISHAPPFGINDDSSEPLYSGFEGLREYLIDKSPQYLIHGHTQPPKEFLIREFGETKIVYVHGEKIIRI